MNYLIIVIIIITAAIMITVISVSKTNPITNEKILTIDNGAESKMLVIIAAHTNNDLREAAIRTILHKLIDIEQLDIVIIQSGNRLIDIVNITSYQVENNIAFADFGKYSFATNNIDMSTYASVLFCNDSCLWTHRIDDFLQMMIDDKFQSEMYGYVESKQIKIHYQSMLRAFNRPGIQKFKDHMNYKLGRVTTRKELIFYFEVTITDIFTFKKCLHKQQGRKIHFNLEQISNNLKSGYTLLKVKALHRPAKKDRTPFNEIHYKEANEDLQDMTRAQLRNHFFKGGKDEGRSWFKNQPTFLLDSVRTFFKDNEIILSLIDK